MKGRTGLYFTAGDPVDLAEKVEWAWNHPRSHAANGTGSAPAGPI